MRLLLRPSTRAYRGLLASVLRTFHGSPPDKCVSCHKPEEIGRTDTQGKRITDAKTKVPFYQELLEQDCVACHSDHRGVLPYRTIRTFSHGLLAKPVQDRCTSCHSRTQDRLHRELGEDCGQCHTQEQWKPAIFSHASLAPAVLKLCIGCHARLEDKLHRKLGDDCGQCHSQEKWKPANFSHTNLATTVLKQCESCHQAPTDKLHKRLTGGCDQCHSQEKWKPATFDHNKYFRIDRAHQTECVTCHPRNDFKQYTCYGCHEHTPAKIRSEHLEEGIRDYEKCVECHRSGGEHDIRYQGRGRGKEGHGERCREGEQRRKHDDD